ncbi:hypothetical protein BGZ63DRAFT_420373 [Mariannaea sp. PMI_226]|nr:hypothetical protein BGZ63DRAFT_420373 [Mariannaea sp. PMI_226]
MSAESSVQVRVEPGNQTQLYHITLAALPFGTDWRQLKDWIRPVCEVDHVEVFPQSTSAWVRIRGKENFDEAWEFISTNTFRGRTLIADDRNRTQPITIKQSTYTSQGQQYSVTPSGQYSLGNSYTQTGASNYAIRSSTPRGSNCLPPTTMAELGSLTYTGAGAGENYSFSDYSHGATSVGQPRVAYALHDQTGGPEYALPYYGPSYGIDPGHTEHLTSQHEAYWYSHIPTEPRKVFVSGFTQQATYDEVKYWIRRRVGLENRIISIEIPMSGSRPYIRGHAFVIFETARGAENGVDLLSKSKFNSQRIKARLTSEGVTHGERGMEIHKVKSSKSPQPEPSSPLVEHTAGPSELTDEQLHGSRRSQSSKDKDRKGKGRESDRKRPSDKKPEKSAAKKSDKSPPMTRASSDKKGEIGPPPMVVNGSSYYKKDRH